MHINETVEIEWNKKLGYVLEKYGSTSSRDVLINCATMRLFNTATINTLFYQELERTEKVTKLFNKELFEDLKDLFLDGMRADMNIPLMIGLLDMAIFQYQRMMSEVNSQHRYLEEMNVSSSGVH